MGKKSIIQDNEEDHICFLCGSHEGYDRHHTWHGSNRKKAEEDGLTVQLCRHCHRLLHDKGINDKTLMEVGERAWLRATGKAIEDWIERYGKNVI